jgi:hypothetical protein
MSKWIKLLITNYTSNIVLGNLRWISQLTH